MVFLQNGWPCLWACALACIVFGVFPAFGKTAASLQDALPQDMHELAGRYRDGQGVPMDRVRAFELYKASAAQGYAPSDYELSKFHNGMAGERVDLAQAHAHLLRAAERGHAQAQAELAFVYLNGIMAVPRNLQAARQWFERAAKQGAIVAQCMLGDFYRDGLGGSRNPVLALKWYRLTAEKDAACAIKSQYELYVIYFSGIGVRKDPSQAIKWLKRSALAGSPQAQKALSMAYRDGNGVEHDPQLARMWLLRSREGVAPHDDHVHEDESSPSHSHRH